MGMLRLFLALCVVSQHTKNPFRVKLLDAGSAVFVFFVISGFYMAMILNEKYTGHGANRTFYWNRVLRLWPAYAISTILLVTVYVHWDYVELLGALPWTSVVFIVLSHVTAIGQDLFSLFSFTPD